MIMKKFADRLEICPCNDNACFAPTLASKDNIHFSSVASPRNFKDHFIDNKCVFFCNNCYELVKICFEEVSSDPCP
jgi:hypothetical protein